MSSPTFSLSLMAGSTLLSAALLLGACGDADTDPSAAGAPGTVVTDDGTEPDEPDAPDETDPSDELPVSTGDPAGDDAPVDAEPAGEEPTTITAPDGGDCSAAGHTVSVVAAPELPAEVDAARRFLIDAALRCDEQLLFTAIEESTMFTASFGADVDPIGFWWELEEAGEQPYLRLAQVLSTTPALADGGELVVWPRVHTGRAQDTTADAWAEVTWLDDPAAAASGDGYLDWRAGITTDGEWRFFVRGD